MSLPAPHLDDRTFEELVTDAQDVVRQSCPEWTDLSPGDPGTVLLEAFAHLTEAMIYRLNRLPEKAYVEFLRLIGVRLRAPGAATVRLLFHRADGDEKVVIPGGTRVATSRTGGTSEPVVFRTTETATLASGETEVEVPAGHCELVVAELAGTGTGLPGQWVRAERAPLIAPIGDDRDLMVGVEATSEEIRAHSYMIFDERIFLLWREVESFTDLGNDRRVYICDRVTGTITFASAVYDALETVPRALAEMPPAGREIRLWYRRGGGPEGNVAAGTLTVLKNPLPGLEVDNPAAAVGGRVAETLENALLRGPLELRSLSRAVTAEDFEMLAKKSSGAVARATALTRASLWTHARPGTVEVILVPRRTLSFPPLNPPRGTLSSSGDQGGKTLSPSGDQGGKTLSENERAEGRITREELGRHETEAARTRVLKALDSRRPLGTRCRVSWAHYKTVSVAARVVTRREENVEEVKARLLRRLDCSLSPLPSGPLGEGWPFGESLHASHIYEILLAEPGVSYAEGVELRLDEMPTRDVRALAADPMQRRTWYAGSGSKLFRSSNDGEGWEAVTDFSVVDSPVVDFNGRVERLCCHPERPGLLAAVTHLEDGEGARLYVSEDCGDSFRQAAEMSFTIRDLDYLTRPDGDVLLLATDNGLFELKLTSGAAPLKVEVDPGEPDLGFFAVAAFTDPRGGTSVAVAARRARGVFPRPTGRRASCRSASKARTSGC